MTSWKTAGTGKMAVQVNIICQILATRCISYKASAFSTGWLISQPPMKMYDLVINLSKSNSVPYMQHRYGDNTINLWMNSNGSSKNNKHHLYQCNNVSHITNMHTHGTHLMYTHTYTYTHSMYVSTCTYPLLEGSS